MSSGISKAIAAPAFTIAVDYTTIAVEDPYDESSSDEDIGHSAYEGRDNVSFTSIDDTRDAIKVGCGHDDSGVDQSETGDDGDVTLGSNDTVETEDEDEMTSGSNYTVETEDEGDVTLGSHDTVETDDEDNVTSLESNDSLETEDTLAAEENDDQNVIEYEVDESGMSVVASDDNKTVTGIEEDDFISEAEQSDEEDVDELEYSDFEAEEEEFANYKERDAKS